MLTRRGLGLAAGTAVVAALSSATGCSRTSGTAVTGAAGSAGAGGAAPVDADTLIADVVTDSLLEGYGRFLFPITMSTPRPGDILADVPDLLTWYSHVSTDTTVDVVTDLLTRRERGETVFYDIYTEEEKDADSTLADTGLFVFPAQQERASATVSPTGGTAPDGTPPAGTAGTPAAPGGTAPQAGAASTPAARPRVAVCSAGGGFAYVASIHDSMPHALWLSRHGYTAFTLQYRPSAQTGCEDLARAISFIHVHAKELSVDPTCYSLWGGSAGARLAAFLGSYGPQRYGGDDVPAPGTVVMQYTGHSDLSGAEPPTFACVGTADGIASWRTMQTRTDAIAAAGTPAELRSYDGLPHGFGLGIGTAAEGWIEEAAAFWQEQINASAAGGG